VKFCKYHVSYIRIVAEVQKYGENIARLQIQAKSFHLEGTKHARLDKEPEILLSY